VKFFDVAIAVRVRETLAVGYRTGPSNGTEFEARELVVSVWMGDGATPDDAVKALAEQLEKLCNDSPPHSGG
jgi:hypothetical protein